MEFTWFPYSQPPTTPAESVDRVHKKVVLGFCITTALLEKRHEINL